MKLYSASCKKCHPRSKKWEFHSVSLQAMLKQLKRHRDKKHPKLRGTIGYHIRNNLLGEL